MEGSQDRYLSRFDRTNQRLLKTLKRSQLSAEDMAGILNNEKNLHRLLYSLSNYKTSQKNHKIAPTVSWNGQSYTVTKEEQQFIEKISQSLLLNPKQCFGIFRAFLEDEVVGQDFDYNDVVLSDVTAFYFNERIALLRCISALLRNSEDTSIEHHHEASEAAEWLLENDLIPRMLQQYKQLNAETVPKHLTERPHQERWANQNVEEQLACLEIIFMCYYTRRMADQETIVGLAKLFNKQAFGTNQLNYALLNDIGRANVSRIAYLCVLILIEVLHLEELALGPEDLEEDVDFSDILAANPVACEPRVVAELCTEFQTWGSLAPHGPVLLAWAGFTCRLTQLQPEEYSEEMLQYQHFGNVAVGVNAFSFIGSLVSEGFDQEEENMTGYKSVLRGLMMLTSTAFSISLLPNNELVEIFCCLFEDQPMLARQFWEHDHAHEARGAILSTAAKKFPGQFVPLVKLLTALAGDSECATMVFCCLREMETFTWPLLGVDERLLEDITSTEGPTVVRLRADWEVTGTRNYMFVIPAGTQGVVHALPDTNEYAIRWHHGYSAWDFFLSALDQFLRQLLRASHIPGERIKQVCALLELIDRLIANNQELTIHLQEHLSLLRRSPKYPGSSLSSSSAGAGKARAPPSVLSVLESTGHEQHGDLLPRLFLALQHASFLPNPPVSLLTACIRCINGIAKSKPRAVWLHMKRVGLLDTVSASIEGRMGGSSGSGDTVSGRRGFMGCIRHIITTVETPKGRYPVTLAFLDLLSTLLRYIKRWQLALETPGDTATPVTASAGSIEEFLPCLNYIKTDLFASYDLWRYTHIYERWEIGIKILGIFDEVLGDVGPPPLSLSDELVMSEQAATPLALQRGGRDGGVRLMTPNRWTATRARTPGRISESVQSTPSSLLAVKARTPFHHHHRRSAYSFGNKRWAGETIVARKMAATPHKGSYAPSHAAYPYSYRNPHRPYASPAPFGINTRTRMPYSAQQTPATTTPTTTSTTSTTTPPHLGIDTTVPPAYASDAAATSQMTGASNAPPGLRDRLLHSILYDGSFHNVLLNIIGIGTAFLDQLYSRRKIKEGKALKRLLVAGLQVLERVLQSRHTEAQYREGGTLHHERQNQEEAGADLSLLALWTGDMSSCSSSTDHTSIRRAGASSLEYAMMTRTVSHTRSFERSYTMDDASSVNSSKAARYGSSVRERVHLINVVASYIHYPYKSKLPLLATRVLTLLCNVTLRGTVRSPSLVGYLGTRADTVRSAFLEKLNDTLEPEELRVSILNLVTTALVGQRGFAVLFMNVTPEEKDPDESSSNKEPTSDANDKRKRVRYIIQQDSVLTTVLEMLQTPQHSLKKTPRLFSEALALLDALWQLAPEHNNIIKALRGVKGFWGWLGRVIEMPVEEEEESTSLPAPSSLSPSSGTTAGDNRFLKETEALLMEQGEGQEAHVVRRCYLHRVQAYALRILALEQFFLSEGKMDDALLVQLQRLSAATQLHTNWVQRFSSVTYSTSMRRRLRQAALDLIPCLHTILPIATVPAARAPVSGARAPFLRVEGVVLLRQEAQRIYGDNYFYDLVLMKEKLMEDRFEREPTASSAPSHEVLRFRTAARELVRTARAVNRMLSLVDAELFALHAWTMFTQVNILKHPDHSVFRFCAEDTKDSYMYQLIICLADLLAHEQREGTVIDTLIHNNSALLTFLTARCFAKSKKTRTRSTPGSKVEYKSRGSVLSTKTPTSILKTATGGAGPRHKGKDRSVSFSFNKGNEKHQETPETRGAAGTTTGARTTTTTRSEPEDEVQSGLLLQFPYTRVVDSLRVVLDARPGASSPVWLSSLTIVLMCVRHAPRKQWTTGLSRAVSRMMPQIVSGLEKEHLRSLSIAILNTVHQKELGNPSFLLEFFGTNQTCGKLLQYVALPFTKGRPMPDTTMKQEEADNKEEKKEKHYERGDRHLPLPDTHMLPSSPSSYPKSVDDPPVSMPRGITAPRHAPQGPRSSPPVSKRGKAKGKQSEQIRRGEQHQGGVPGTEATAVPSHLQSRLETCIVTLRFLISLSESQVMAELLCSEGIMLVLCNDSDSFPGYDFSVHPYTNDGKYNLWHKAWCLMLSLVTVLLRTLANNDHFLHQVSEFVTIHQERLARAIDPSTTFSLTLGALAETEKTTALVYHLWAHHTSWRSQNPEAARVFKRSIIGLVRRYVVLISRGNHLARRAHAVSHAERELLATCIRKDTNEATKKSEVAKDKGKEPASDSSSKPLFGSKDKADKEEKERKEGSNAGQGAFYILVEHSVFGVLANVVSFLRVLTPKVFGKGVVPLDADPELYQPVFFPEGQVDRMPPSSSDAKSDNERPPLGLLVRLLNNTLTSFRSLKDSDKGQQFLLQQHHPEYSGALHQLLFVMENCMYICLAHVSIYISFSYLTAKNKREGELIRYRVRDEIVSDLEAFATRVNHTFADARDCSVPGSTTSFFKEAVKALRAWMD